MSATKINVAAITTILLGSFALTTPPAEAGLGYCDEESVVCESQGSDGCYSEFGGDGVECSNHTCENGYCMTLCSDGEEAHEGDCSAN